MLKPAVDLTRTRIILLATLFIMSTGNLELFERLLEIYPPTLSNLPFLTSLALFFSFATALFLVLITPGSAGRWVLASILVLSSQAAYYMDQYGVVIDGVMIDNILATNVQEAKGLMSWNLLLRTVFLGLLPAWLLVRHWPKKVPIAGVV
ncbi:MAG: DUF1705 domain-containing protein, partial [Methylobacterium sp.]|nr:DUF1705 domain-containing protein [Methylobacterium sp.]